MHHTILAAYLIVVDVARAVLASVDCDWQSVAVPSICRPTPTEIGEKCAPGSWRPPALPHATKMARRHHVLQGHTMGCKNTKITIVDLDDQMHDVNDLIQRSPGEVDDDGVDEAR